MIKQAEEDGTEKIRENTKIITKCRKRASRNRDTHTHTFVREERT